MKQAIGPGILVMLWIATIWVLCTPEISGKVVADADGGQREIEKRIGHGVPHPTFLKMEQGGDGLARHQNVLVGSWLLGASIVTLFVGLLAWAARTVRATSIVRTREAAFWIGGLIYQAVFGAMCWSYYRSLQQAEPTFFGPFPTSVSWMVFGIWLAPCVFIWLFVTYFDRWIWPQESVERFQALVDRAEANRQAATETSTEG